MMKSLDVAKETREVFISKISTIENLSHGTFPLHSVFMYAFHCFSFVYLYQFLRLFLVLIFPNEKKSNVNYNIISLVDASGSP